MTQTTTTAKFTPAERDYIRRELHPFFSTLPSVADGFPLRNWRGGPLAGQPKLPLPAKGLLERGLMRIDAGQPWSRLVFTVAGLAGLRAMMRNPRFTDPVTFAHIRQERGIGPGPEAAD